MTIALVILYFAVGVGLGAIHFAALRRNVDSYVAHGLGARTLALHSLRLVLVAAAFFVLAQKGGALVLAALGGFMVARLLLVRRAREGS